MTSVFISCDFDGTLTFNDTVNALLDAYALPEWRVIEDEWCAGKFGSRECLARQTELLRIRPDALDAYLDRVEVDPDAAAFFADCAELGIPVAVVSDGYDWAVRRVLAGAGVTGAPIIANRLVHRGEDRWSVLFPHASGGCGYGVCKCQAARGRSLRVHIGDGRSDFCAAEHADLVFAKGALLRELGDRGNAVQAFERFADLRPRLVRLEEDLVRARASRAIREAGGR